VQLADDVLQVTCRLATQAFVVRISRDALAGFNEQTAVTIVVQNDALAGREVLIRMRRKPMKTTTIATSRLGGARSSSRRASLRKNCLFIGFSRANVSESGSRVAQML
jgi:hypothetical protein